MHDLAHARRASGTAVWAAGLTAQQQRMFERYGPHGGARAFATVEKAIAAAHT